MLCKIDKNVWFGDKPSIEECSEEVKSIINVAHSIRKPYWENVSKLPWDVWYFKLASPDREILSEEHMIALCYVIGAIKQANKFPLLCHCRMGGHRGPSCGLLAYWFINGRTVESFNLAYEKILEFRPSFGKDNDRRVFRNSIFSFCNRHSINEDYKNESCL